MTMAKILQIVVHPRRGSSPAVFDAYRGGEWLCRSTVPFLEAARRLVAEGAPPDTILEMWHAGGQTWAVRGAIGTAAALRVVEDEGVPRFRKWEPYRGPCR